MVSSGLLLPETPCVLHSKQTYSIYYGKLNIFFKRKQMGSFVYLHLALSLCPKHTGRIFNTKTAMVTSGICWITPLRLCILFNLFLMSHLSEMPGFFVFVFRLITAPVYLLPASLRYRGQGFENENQTELLP